MNEAKETARKLLNLIERIADEAISSHNNEKILVLSEFRFKKNGKLAFKRKLLKISPKEFKKNKKEYTVIFENSGKRFLGEIRQIAYNGVLRYQCRLCLGEWGTELN